MTAPKTTTNGLHNRIKGKGKTPAPPMPDSSGEVEQSNVFALPDTNLDYLHVVVAGTTEAMTNKMSDQAVKSMMSGVIDKPKEKTQKPGSEAEAAFMASHVCLVKPGKGDPWERFTEHVYGIKVIPFKKGAVDAMSHLKIKGKNVMQGAFFMHGPFRGVTPLLSQAPELTRAVVDNHGLRNPEELFALAAKPKIDARAITTSNGMGGKGTASVSIRPLFEDWFAEFYVGYYSKIIQPKQLIQLIQTAGMSIGVGSYRAARSGDMFGLYRVVGMQGMPTGWEPKRYRIDQNGMPIA